jgi:hypothetical protein
MIDIDFLNQVLFFMALFILIAIYVEFREVRRLLKEVRDASAAAAYYLYYYFGRGGAEAGNESGSEDGGGEDSGAIDVASSAVELCVVEHLRSVNCDTLDNIKQKCPGASHRILSKIATRRRGGVYCLKSDLR